MLAWALSVGVEVGAAEAAPGTRTEDWTPIGTDHVVLILDGGDDEGPSLAASLAAAAQAAPPPTPRPLAFEYSEGYRVRRKIHKYASFATLPLFVAQFAVGEKLYDQGPNADDGLRSTHTALGVGIGALFTVNTVTASPNSNTLRRVDGVLEDVPCYLNVNGCPSGSEFSFGPGEEVTWNPAFTTDVPFRCGIPRCIATSTATAGSAAPTARIASAGSHARRARSE